MLGPIWACLNKSRSRRKTEKKIKNDSSPEAFDTEDHFTVNKYIRLLMSTASHLGIYYVFLENRCGEPFQRLEHTYLGRLGGKKKYMFRKCVHANSLPGLFFSVTFVDPDFWICFPPYPRKTISFYSKKQIHGICTAFC